MNAKTERMYVVSYDISDDRLRGKIAKTMEGYGRRVQYSVFECRLTDKRYQELYAELMQLMIDEPEGNIRIYHICANCETKVQTIGVDEDAKNELDEMFIIV